MGPADRVVGVVGARGGAGASTLAAALAAALARRWAADALSHRGALVRAPAPRSRESRSADAGPMARSGVVLADLDGAGGGLDVHLGIEAVPGVRWADLLDARGEVSGEDLAAVLPVWAGVPVLSVDRWRPGPVPPEVVTDVLDALTSCHATVVLDLGRPEVLAGGAGPRRCTTVVVLAPRDLRSVAGVVALRDALLPVVRDVRLVVCGDGRGGLGVLEVAHVVDLPVAGTLPRERRLPALVERGMGPVPRSRGALDRAVGRLVGELT